VFLFILVLSILLLFYLKPQFQEKSLKIIQNLVNPNKDVWKCNFIQEDI